MKSKITLRSLMIPRFGRNDVLVVVGHTDLQDMDELADVAVKILTRHL
jgi:hypothetical protein